MTQVFERAVVALLEPSPLDIGSGLAGSRGFGISGRTDPAELSSSAVPIMRNGRSSRRSAPSAALGEIAELVAIGRPLASEHVGLLVAVELDVSVLSPTRSPL